MKQVQISEELFSRLYAYFIMDRREPLQEQIIKDQLQEKFDRIQRRADYIPQKKTGLNSPAGAFNQQETLYISNNNRRKLI